MKFRLVFCFLLLTSALFGSLQLKERLKTAIPGSYLVTLQGKNIVVLIMAENDQTTLRIDEITLPASAAKGLVWKDWLESGAPGNSSWISSSIDLESGSFIESFSYTFSGWIDRTKSNPFFTKLLNLSFEPLPDKKRKRIGSGQPAWVPPTLFEGTLYRDVNHSVWVAKWPRDQSELSKKRLEVYLPEEEPLLGFFPTWVEVEGGIGKARLRVIDSGKDLRSPQFRPPHRSLQSHSPFEHPDEGLTLRETP